MKSIQHQVKLDLSIFGMVVAIIEIIRQYRALNLTLPPVAVRKVPGQQKRKIVLFPSIFMNKFWYPLTRAEHGWFTLWNPQQLQLGDPNNCAIPKIAG